MKFDNKKLLSMTLIALSSSAVHASGWGTAKQEACINLLTPIDKEIAVTINQYINDSGIVATTNEKINLKDGAHGEICGRKKIVHDIYVNGRVGVSWKIEDSNSTLREFSTESSFNGQGANNDWDIDEKGQCAAYGGKGVYLTGKGDKSCRFIKDVPDESVIKVTYAVDLGSYHPSNDHGYTHYNPEQVVNGQQKWAVGSLAFSEITQKVYECLQGNLCNESPSYYEPGVGQVWEQAWIETSVKPESDKGGNSFYVYPEGLGDYKPGITVVRGRDGGNYRCLPNPNGGWCNIDSTLYYEPGFGIAWQDAWELLPN